MRNRYFLPLFISAILFAALNAPAQTAIPDEEFPLRDEEFEKAPAKPVHAPEVAKLNHENVADAYPYLSADGLRLYYSSGYKTGFSNIAISERSHISEPFGEGRPLCPGYEEGFYCATFTADELTMYLGKNGDIYVARRSSLQSSFGKPEQVEGLPEGFIFAPAISPDGKELVLVADHNPDEIFQFRMNSYNKAVAADKFSLPVTSYKEYGTGQYSKDGLQYYLTVYTEMNKAVLLRGTRNALAEPFANWEELTFGKEVTSMAGQPTVNGDGTILLFISSPANTWNGDDLVYVTDFSRSGFAKNASASATEKQVPEAPVLAQAKLYPNPAQHSVTVELEQEPASGLTLWLVDMNGRRVKQQRITARRTIVEIDGLTAGIYIYEIRDDSGKLTASGKLVRAK